MYWIINARTKQYVEVADDAESFDGEWKENYWTWTTFALTTSLYFVCEFYQWLFVY